ncbi:MAG: glycosyltransferase 87 family protein, partial [bacterium]
MAPKYVSWKAIIWSAILFHLVLAFHNCCGVDGANYFSAYSQYTFGIPAARHNYFSSLFSCVAIFHLLSSCLFIPLTASIKIINAACWIACSYLVAGHFCNHGRSSSRWWFACLVFNPIAVFDIHYHVQHDAMALFLMVLGLLFYGQRRVSSKIIAGLSWAIAASMKVYPLFLLPLFIFDRRHSLKDKFIFYGSSAFFLFVPEVPWICRIGWSETFLKAISYKSFNRFGLYRVVDAISDKQGTVHWAVEGLFRLLDGHAPIVVCGLILIVGLFVYLRGISLFRAMGLCFALILLICTRNTPQALMLVAPFLVLFRKKAALIFANASYSLVLAFFYLLDNEMNGSYCLLKTLSSYSLSRNFIAFWENLLPIISLYLWGWIYLLASFAFVYGYWPARREEGGISSPALGYRSGLLRFV